MDKEMAAYYTEALLTILRSDAPFEEKFKHACKCMQTDEIALLLIHNKEFTAWAVSNSKLILK